MPPLQVEDALRHLGLDPAEVARRLQGVPGDGPDPWGARTALFHDIVKQARKRALLEHHPDRHAQDDERAMEHHLERAQEINRIADALLKMPVRPPPPPQPQVRIIIVSTPWCGSSTSCNTYTSIGNGWTRIW